MSLTAKPKSAGRPTKAHYSVVPPFSRGGGWYRLKLKFVEGGMRRIRLSAPGNHGQRVEFEYVISTSQFSAFAFVRRSACPIDVDISATDGLPSDAVLGIRRITALEYAWKTLKRGFLKRPLSYLSIFSDPGYDFFIAFDYPGFVDEAYLNWIRDREPKAIQNALTATAEVVCDVPEIAILIPVHDPEPTYLRKAIDSVRAQSSPRWRLSVADDSSTGPEIREILEAAARDDARVTLTLRDRHGGISAATNDAFSRVNAPLVACLDHDDLLAPTAVEIVTRHFAAHPNCHLLFSDEDKVDPHDRRGFPHFKPRTFSPELFYSSNYVNHWTVHRSETIRAIGGWRGEFDGAQDYDVILRSIKGRSFASIHHVAVVLYHWRAVQGSTALDPKSKPYVAAAGQRALIEHFRNEPGTTIEIINDNQYRVRRDPGVAPGVSVLVPFRDRPDLLRMCAESILKRTDYPDLELILIDNGSTDADAVRVLDELGRDPRVKVIRDDGKCNHARLNNLGCRQASKEFLCLFRNEIEVIDPGWLRDMVSYAGAACVGCVGAKLLTPGGLIHHAGIVLGIDGVGAHVFENQADAPGRLQIACNYSAVTGACLVVRRDIYRAVGGLDEACLPVGYNDVDLCIRIQAAGYRNVFTPFARLVYHGTAGPGLEDNPDKFDNAVRERKIMLSRHAAILQQDPCYSPHLTLRRTDFTISDD